MVTIITSVQAPLPVGQTTAAPNDINRQASRARDAGAVGQAVLPQAVRHAAPPPGLAEARLQVGADQATLNAHAAREAYIKASIAAGVNPLPLPGV